MPARSMFKTCFSEWVTLGRIGTILANTVLTVVLLQSALYFSYCCCVVHGIPRVSLLYSIYSVCRFAVVAVCLSLACLFWRLLWPSRWPCCLLIPAYLSRLFLSRDRSRRPSLSFFLLLLLYFCFCFGWLVMPSRPYRLLYYYTSRQYTSKGRRTLQIFMLFLLVLFHAVCVICCHSLLFPYTAFVLVMSVLGFIKLITQFCPILFPFLLPCRLSELTVSSY